MTRKAKPGRKGWHVYKAGPSKYGVMVDGVRVLSVNPRMIAVARGETARQRNAFLQDFAQSLSAHQAMRLALFTLYPKLVADKKLAKRFSLELDLMVEAMDKSVGDA